MCAQVPNKSKGNTCRTNPLQFGLNLAVMSAFLFSISSLLIKVSSFIYFECLKAHERMKLNRANDSLVIF